MKANELLFWLSARRQGSWQQFRAAVEELHSAEIDSPPDGTAVTGDDGFPLHQQLRLDLERLAHVEFFSGDCESGWRVAPPMLAAHRVHGGLRAVLCGARSPALWARTLRAAKNVRYETFDSCGAPQVFRLVARDTAALGEAAAQAGVHLQHDAPLAILSHLPPLVSPSKRHPQSELQLGADWSIHQFDPVALRWKQTDRHRVQTAAIGMFRFRLSFQPRPRYYLRWAGATYELPRAIATYVLLHRRRQHVLRYNAATCDLSLPAVCRPPRLLERALVLCSGFPPSFAPDTGCLTYSDVPLETARLATELLLQPLR